MPGRSDDARADDEAIREPTRLSPNTMPMLPGASQAAHVTISGGSLAGLDVVRVDDESSAPLGKIEVGARVQLQDGSLGDVVEVNGRLLSKFGVLPGGVKVKLGDGKVLSKSSHEIARVIPPPA